VGLATVVQRRTWRPEKAECCVTAARLVRSAWAWRSGASAQGAVTQTLLRSVANPIARSSGYRRRTCACACVLRGLGARSDASGARPAGAWRSMLAHCAFRLPARRKGRDDAARHAARYTTASHAHGAERRDSAAPRHAARPAAKRAAILDGSRQARRGACAGSRAAAACCSLCARRARRAEGKGGEASGCKGRSAAGSRTQPLCCCCRCCRARRLGQRRQRRRGASG